MSSGQISLVALSLVMLWAYLALVFFDGIRLIYWVLIVLVSFIGVYWLARLLYRRQLISATRLKYIAFASFVTLLSILASDVGYGVFVNGNEQIIIEGPHEREIDPQIWYGEFIPRWYYPTEKNFPILKPNVTSSGYTYGARYTTKSLLKSPTMVNSVLELKHVSHIVDEHGFRETTSLEQSHIFALGDSFTFGALIDQDKTWVELLEKTIGESIYNLGIPGMSPRQELFILEYVLETKKPPYIKNGHLLWMILDNDLQDDYRTFAPITRPSSFDGTIVRTLISIPGQVRESSVINRFLTNRLTAELPRKDTDNDTPRYVVDGVRLNKWFPLYYSDQHGASMFNQGVINNIIKEDRDESYVKNHPNRPLLDQTFDEMAALSKKHGFKVTVLIVPLASRLYAKYFENFPQILEESHFINYLVDRANRSGFDVVNLYQLMKPYAAEEFLYWRDDDHWNERGNEVAAEIIANHVFKK